MKRFVEGSYTTQETAALAVDALVARGYKKSDMTLITNETAARNLEDLPGIRILVTDTDHDSDTGLWARIKNAFSSGNHTVDLIRDDELLSQYQHKLDQGNILLLVESGMDDAEDDTLKEKVDEDSDLGTAVTPGTDRRTVIVPPSATTDHTMNNAPGQTGVIPPVVDLDEDNDRDLKR